MDSDLELRLKYEKKNLLEARAKYTIKLERCKGRQDTFLKTSPRSKNKTYYYAKPGRKGKYKYIGPSNAAEVKLIKEAHFLQEVIRRIDSNLKLIDAISKNYASYDKYTVNNSLPDVYKVNVAPLSDAYAIEGAAWKKEKLKYQATFPENYPEFKTERTSDNIMVKTVSEVVLYERLKSAGLYFVYELPLAMNDYGPPAYPDFVVLSPIDMKTEIIIEYVGRLDMPKYREDFARKVDRYMACGYKPGVTLFFVYSDKDGHIDSMQINRILADICG